MYRDAAIALDEHDRAVGAILIGEALIIQCERAIERVHELQAASSKGAVPWRTVREIHEDYPEIWRQFDRAQRVLAGRGVNTAGYDELRPQVRPSLKTLTAESTEVVDPDALEDARRAMEELKLVVPGADWRGIDERTAGLVATPKLRKPHRLPLAGVFASLALAVVVWGYAIAPAKHDDPDAVTKRQIATIAFQQIFTTAELQQQLGQNCHVATAQDLMRALVSSGRHLEAKAFAHDYTTRCGNDETLSTWAWTAMSYWRNAQEHANK